jgi:hypothetical protein
MAEGNDWKAGLPEELKAEPMFKDIPDVPTLAKVARDLNTYKGASLRPPGPDASPEARKEFAEKLEKLAPGVMYLPDDEAARAEVEAQAWGKLGRPKDAKEYAPPKDLELPAAALEALRAEAAEEGLTRKQFEARAKRVAAALGKHSADAQAAQAALKKELGGAYGERIAIAAATAEKLGFPEGLVQAIKAGEVDLATFKAISAVAKGFGEKPIVGPQGGGAPGLLTPEEARLKAEEIAANPAYWDPSKPEHEMLKQKRLSLMKQAYPD